MMQHINTPSDLIELCEGLIHRRYIPTHLIGGYFSDKLQKYLLLPNTIESDLIILHFIKKEKFTIEYFQYLEYLPVRILYQNENIHVIKYLVNELNMNIKEFKRYYEYYKFEDLEEDIPDIDPDDKNFFI